MSDSKKNTHPAKSNIVTGALILIVILLAFFLPPANVMLLTIAFIYCWWAAWRLPEPQNAQDFTFTATELDTFEALEPRAKRMQRELAELRKRGAHLSKRKDGYFSERSKLGKQLNPQIQALELDLGEDRAFIVEYSNFADDRKHHYTAIKSLRLTVTLTTILFVVITTMLANSTNNFIGTVSLINNRISLVAAPTDIPNLWGAMTVAITICVISYLPFEALSGLVTRLTLAVRPNMATDEAIEFSSNYAAVSGIGEA